jgi:2-polyprenyl-3-methyl-5-hydroxy-6-metoxy-1,4-benzoquinol methylase
MSLRGKIAVLLKRVKIKIQISDVNKTVTKNNISNWYSYIIKERKNRKDIISVCNWIAWNFKSKNEILETGCGIGSNLFWLAQNGFNKLHGFDINNQVISSALELSNILNYKIIFWCDEGLNPINIQNKYKIILALNWIHYCKNFNLEMFLKIYSNYIVINGFIIIEIIDASFNSVENNQFHTSDWTKPLHERRPSEYLIRISEVDVLKIAKQNKFEIKKVFKTNQIIPRKTYVFYTI